MWSATGDQSSSTPVVAHSKEDDSSRVSTVTTSAMPIHFVVVEPPPDSTTCNNGNEDDDDYPWGLTYRRLRRASAMIGASAVAIDNKIEQAMDLVKSHLLFAVREEIELLKEQIKELTERNCQLEMENSVLKASASPDTLAQLAATRPLAPPT